MTVTREPVLKQVPLKELRPTQITVGFREVAERRRIWRQRKAKKKGVLLRTHMIPAVLGPKDGSGTRAVKTVGGRLFARLVRPRR